MREELKRVEGLKKLRLKIKAILEGTLLGTHKSPLHGFSSEFVEHRGYSPGDDIRMIDWKVFARKERFYTKKFSEETNSNIYFLLDSSKSMDFGNPSKFEYAKVLIGSLSFIFYLQRDSPSLYVFSDNQKLFIPPSTKRANLEKILDTLEDLKPGGKTESKDFFLYLSQIIKKKSITFLFTDYYHKPNDFIMGLKFLRSKGNKVYSVRLICNEDYNLPKNPPFILIDLETHKEIAVNEKNLWDEFKKKLTEFDKNLYETIVKSGIKNLVININESYEKNLIMILRSL
ncbi:MAG: DUF58 domain-containing protein [Candidatus Hydrothermales bacterium]